MLTRVVDGAIRPGMKIKVMSNDRTFEVMEVNFAPKRTKKTELLTGEVGYLLRQYAGSGGRQNWRYAHGCGIADAWNRFQGIKTSNRWCSGGCIPPTPLGMKTCGMRWSSSG